MVENVVLALTGIYLLALGISSTLHALVGLVYVLTKMVYKESFKSQQNRFPLFDSSVSVLF